MYEDSGIYKPLLPDAPYTIQNADGEYYTGCCGFNMWSHQRLDAFKYTESGAARRMASFPAAFHGCRITRTP